MMLDTLGDLFLPFTRYLFMKRALLGCLALSLSAGPLGVFLLLRRMTLIGDALAHGLLPGVALSFIWFGPSLVAMSLGGVVAGLVLAILATLASRHAVITEDAAFAGFYLFSMALGVLLLSLYSQNVDLLHILFGSILTISQESLIFMSISSVITMGFLGIFYRPLLMECFDPVFFYSVGGSRIWMRLGFLCLLTLNLVTAFQALGTFMALGLLVLPTLIMRLLSNRLWVICLGSCLVGFGCSVVGLLLSYYGQWASGPAIIVMLGICYILALGVSSLRNYLVLGLILGGMPAMAIPVKVVVTFTVLQDFVQKVGGPDVQVHSLVGPNMDTHQYHPTPKDSQYVAEAQLVIMNGLNFERWISRLLDAAGYKGPVVVATQNVTPRFFPGPHPIPDPHAWQDVQRARSYVRTITAALCQVAPHKAAHFRRRAAAYDQRLQALDQWIHHHIQTIPPQHRIIITYHNAFRYYAAAYHLQVLSLVGLSTEVEASAQGISSLIDRLRQYQVRALFMENMHKSQAMKILAEETGIAIGGVLYSDSLSCADEQVGTYEDMMRWNTQQLVEKLRQQ